MRKSIGFLESNLSGSGFKGLEIASQMGYRVVFFTRDLERYLNEYNGPYYFDNFVDEIVHCETNDLNQMLDIIKKRPKDEFSAFLTLGEYDVEICSQIANFLSLPSLNPTAAKIARNKYLTRKICFEKNLLSPRYSLVHTEEEVLKLCEEFSFPCIIKPIDETSSADVLKCQNPDAVLNQFKVITSKSSNTREQKRASGVLIEEFISGFEVSVETITFNSKTTVLGITDKFTTSEHFVEIGHNFPSSLPNKTQEKCNQLAKDVLSAINYDFGVAHIEMKIQDNEPMLIEINARPAGGKITDLVEHVLGFSYIKSLIEISLGDDLKLPIKNAPELGTAIRFVKADSDGFISAVDGADVIKNSVHVLEADVENLLNRTVVKPRRNGDRLGFILTHSSNSFQAGREADALIDQLKLTILAKETVK